MIDVIKKNFKVQVFCNSYQAFYEKIELIQHPFVTIVFREGFSLLIDPDLFQRSIFFDYFLEGSELTIGSCVNIIY
jgi:hypothetical protein